MPLSVFYVKLLGALVWILVASSNVPVPLLQGWVIFVSLVAFLLSSVYLTLLVTGLADLIVTDWNFLVKCSLASGIFLSPCLASLAGCPFSSQKWDPKSARRRLCLVFEVLWCCHGSGCLVGDSRRVLRAVKFQLAVIATLAAREQISPRHSAGRLNVRPRLSYSSSAALKKKARVRFFFFYARVPLLQRCTCCSDN